MSKFELAESRSDSAESKSKLTELIIRGLLCEIYGSEGTRFDSTESTQVGTKDDVLINHVSFICPAALTDSTHFLNGSDHLHAYICVPLIGIELRILLFQTSAVHPTIAVVHPMGT